jgi:hypothetical protein
MLKKTGFRIIGTTTKSGTQKLFLTDESETVLAFCDDVRALDKLVCRCLFNGTKFEFPLSDGGAIVIGVSLNARSITVRNLSNGTFYGLTSTRHFAEQLHNLLNTWVSSFSVDLVAVAMAAPIANPANPEKLKGKKP